VVIVPLVTYRDELRARLRQTWPAGVPVLTDAVELIADYLTAERERGRVAADADVDLLAPTLIGAAHLLYADRHAPPDATAVHRTVTTILAGVVGEPRDRRALTPYAHPTTRRHRRSATPALGGSRGAAEPTM
jgi:hypothetical protein